MSEEQDSQALTMTCDTCGAVFPISPEDLVVTCSYCGESYDVEGKKIPDHQMLPSKDINEIRANFEEFLKRNRAESGNIVELRANYIPYWVVPFESDTHYYGVKTSTVTRYKTVTYKDSEGNTKTKRVPYTVTVYRDEEGDFHRSGRENVIARKHTAFYGFDHFQKGLFLDNIQPFDFNGVKEHNAEFINAEVDAGESQQNAYGRIENHNRSIAAGKVSKLVRCDSNINLQYPIYVHAPLWQARYKYQGKIYKMSASGDTGTVLKGEIPLSFARRMMNLIIGLAIMFTGIILGEWLGFQILVAGDDKGYIMIIVGLVMMALSFFFTRTAFKMQLEKSEKIKKPKKRKKNKEDN
ncbi:hypothetical protein GF325_11765 [Candidatus Bathyarchaeota archaeon]|nr:hypothetical protein [Candidatus Bathyarchaeota archaeon]